MKKLVYTLIITSIALVGCGKEEASSSEVAEVVPPKPPETVEVAAPASSETTSLNNSLVAAADSAKKAAMPEVEKQVMATQDAVAKKLSVSETKKQPVATMPTKEAAAVTVKTVAVEMEQKAVVPKVEVTQSKAPEAPEASADSMVSKAVGATGALASQIDWTSLSWDKVSEIPYDDKAQLVAWATQQADTWKSKLSSAAMDKGVGMLNTLGDSGWQGALKNVVSAINGVRESSPETWDLARGALVSSWDKFETQASQLLGN